MKYKVIIVDIHCLKLRNKARSIHTINNSTCNYSQYDKSKMIILCKIPHCVLLLLLVRCCLSKDGKFRVKWPTRRKRIVWMFLVVCSPCSNFRNVDFESETSQCKAGPINTAREGNMHRLLYMVYTTFVYRHHITDFCDLHRWTAFHIPTLQETKRRGRKATYNRNSRMSVQVDAICCSIP